MAVESSSGIERVRAALLARRYAVPASVLVEETGLCLRQVERHLKALGARNVAGRGGGLVGHYALGGDPEPEPSDPGPPPPAPVRLPRATGPFRPGVLPILPDAVRCEPYRASISPSSCVERWRGANVAWRRTAVEGEGEAANGEAARTASLRFSECAGCPAGADRSWFFRQGGFMKTIEKADKKCPSCGDLFKRLRTTGLCGGCTNAGGKVPRQVRVDRSAEREAHGPPEVTEPVSRYLIALAKVEEIRARHKREMDAALSKLREFADAHDAGADKTIEDLAREALARIFERPGLKAAPIARAEPIRCAVIGCIAELPPGMGNRCAAHHEAV